MTKNNAMRLGSVMLVLALLSTCALWGTFAKYTTGVTGSDTARVAYWGFGTTTTTVDLFDTSYNSDAVKSAGTDNVVAPGTSKTQDIKFTYTNGTAGSTSIAAPEVKYNFTIKAEADTGNSTTKLDANPNFKWTLKCPGDSEAAEYDTLDALATGISNKYSTTTINAGSLPDSNWQAGDNTISIGWKWAYETTDEVSTTDKNEMTEQDEKDTEAGNATSLDNIAVKLTVKCEQAEN